MDLLSRKDLWLEKELIIEQQTYKREEHKNSVVLFNLVRRNISMSLKWCQKASKISILISCSQELSKHQLSALLMIPSLKKFRQMTSGNNTNLIKLRMIWWKITTEAKTLIREKRKIKMLPLSLKNSSLKQDLSWRKSLRRIKPPLSSTIEELPPRETQSNASRLWNSLKKSSTFFPILITSQLRFHKLQVFTCSKVVLREKSQSLILFWKRMDSTYTSWWSTRLIQVLFSRCSNASNRSHRCVLLDLLIW